MSKDPRRTFARRAVRRAVRIECDVLAADWDEPVQLEMSNLSEYGLQLDTPYPLAVGQEVALHFELATHAETTDDFTAPSANASPPPTPIVARGSVRWVRLWRRKTDRNHTARMGIAFTMLPRAEQHRLGHALVGRPPQLPTPTWRV